MELARLAVDSGGDTASIQRTLDPTVVPVPDIEGSKEDRCELTRTPYGRLFIKEEINSYLESLFEMIVARGPSVGVNVSLSRFDFFHGHVFLARDSGRLGILFHAKEYPAYDKEVFPCNMGYCQIGTNVSYDDSMNLRNILWLAPLASNSSNEWLAPGVLVVLDARPTGIIYKDLIPEYVQIARTLYEDDFGDVAFDVNYLNTGVSKDIDPEADSVLTCMLQAVAVPVLGNACHVFMHGLNRVQIYGAEKLHQVLENRMENKPLITGMDMAISKLNRGGWVHIFPEGSRSRDGGKTMGCIKRGIGRLILDADNLPIVVPFVHTGMQDIMPVGAKLPRIGKTLCNYHFEDGKLYDAVSTRIGDQLQMLKAQVDRLAVQEALQSQHYHDYVAERAAGIVQHVDWEALGMDNYMSIGEDHASPPRQEPSSEQPLVEKQMEENSQDRYFRYTGSTELMLCSARCLVANSRVKENFENIQEIAPLKAWNNFWMPLYESQVCNREILL
ncbi:hypothetical protein R3W88_025015 [Solanum pinnatisectum]|uniref:Phospholipid/glycerol acyltransferase domain-containing protein n=1 Tax=Solanum pinnatisectum TaxID=50273 RepID=A0AAV9M5S4_9SOLN|nr:hypothetical protein R3W88_025015 [Solanum pinnatisectum]